LALTCPGSLLVLGLSVIIVLFAINTLVPNGYHIETVFALTGQTNETISALNNKGLALVNLGRPLEAITYIDKALLLTPNYTTALNNKGFALYSLARYNYALPYFDKALAIDPNDATVLNSKGLTLHALGKNLMR
jgi:tetratricopeptide (TPR) repeat protein